MKKLTLLLIVICVVFISSCQLSRADRLVQNEAVYSDKVYAAWLGKFIGLIAGQPTEGWGRELIEQKARAIDFYPITGYMPENFDSPHTNFLLGNFEGSPPNDDTDLMLTSLIALRQHGTDLTAQDIAETWLKYVPNACTAERVALHNFQNDIWPPQSASIDNPYQEMIGAQMRADIWGMIAPGIPVLAADYAYRDASISHTGNGIYGAQFIAALVSSAMVESDINKIIQTALKTIPYDCAYAEAVRDAVAWHNKYVAWQSAWEQLDKKWGFLKNGKRDDIFTDEKYISNKEFYMWNDTKWVYADVNGAAVAMALLYGEGDFTKSVCLAVMIGYDNDCNAGTVGAVLGAINGTQAIDESWKVPLLDTYHTTLNQSEKQIKISDIALETAKYGLKVVKTSSARR
ncbi:MAG: ADP-ribosylglycohydrolase family protein [Proteiniphilum sp.]|nr:ADP-ribosylglycohydrolase family protein [Proteiniphilum sp.]